MIRNPPLDMMHPPVNYKPESEDGGENAVRFRNCDTDVDPVEVIALDFKIAQQCLERDPECKHLWAAALPGLAKRHAVLGDSMFRLTHGMRGPRNPREVAIGRRCFGVDSEEEFQRRLLEDEGVPLDGRRVQSYYDTLTERLHYLQFGMEAIYDVCESPLNWALAHENEETATRWFRDMLAELPFSATRRHQVLAFAVDARLARNMPMPTVGWIEASSALTLIYEVLGWFDRAWNKIRGGKPDPRGRPASVAFIKTWSKELPTMHSLHALLSEEAGICRLALKGGPQGPAQPQIEIHNNLQLPSQPAPVVNVNFGGSRVDPPPPVSSDGTGAPTAKDDKPLRANLRNWALGMDDRGDWILFRKHKSEWRVRRHIKIPKGNPTKVARELARQGGRLSSEEATDLFKEDYPGKNVQERRRVVTDALTKVKTAICEGIRSVSRNPDIVIRNPIPNASPGWVAKIEMGYAMRDENDRTTFRPAHEK